MCFQCSFSIWTGHTVFSFITTNDPQERHHIEFSSLADTDVNFDRESSSRHITRVLRKRVSECLIMHVVNFTYSDTRIPSVRQYPGAQALQRGIVRRIPSVLFRLCQRVTHSYSPWVFVLATIYLY